MKKAIKIVIIGRYGMLSSSLRYYFKKKFVTKSFSRKEFNILKDEVKKLKLDENCFVVNASGLTNRNLDSSKSKFYQINSKFPKTLANHCKKEGAKLIHISTDCVFNGKTGFYKENSKNFAKDIYGRSKLLGEPKNSMVLRTSIFGPERKNFHMLLCWFFSQKEEINGYTNSYFNGITTIELGRVLEKIIKKGLYSEGKFHIFTKDISKYSLLLKIRKIFKKNIIINKLKLKNKSDKRLRTLYPSFLKKLNILSHDKQIRQIHNICDSRGRFKSLTF